MAASAGPPLPYRTDPDELRRYLDALTRGRNATQIRALGFSAKSFEGTATAAEALGLAENRNGAITELGRRLALAEEADRAGVIGDVLEGYAPFSRLLDVARAGGAPDPTPLTWIETWWAAHGFGSSESNRAEAASVFARLVEAAGLGSYVQGRKGRVSRIEWTDGPRTPPAGAVAGPAAGRPAGASSPAQRGPRPWSHRSVPSHSEPPVSPAVPPPVPPPAASSPGPEGPVGDNVVVWHLGRGRVVHLHLPADLTPGERRRLRGMLDALLEA